MKEFVLIFRMDILTPEAQPDAEQMREYMSHWMAWINHISARGRLAEGGNHMLPAGKVLRKGVQVSDGPYVVNNESVAGYIIILACDEADALSIAKECPILQGEGTSVELRQAASPQSVM
jgi:hypothetical protein